MVLPRYERVCQLQLLQGSLFLFFTLTFELISENESELVSTLKINNCDGCAVRELEIEEHIAKSDSSHRGHTLLRTNEGHFEIDGPQGKHLCMLYHPLREPLSTFQRRFENSVIPYPLLKVYLLILLEALDCLHSVCNVVHSGNYYLVFEVEYFQFIPWLTVLRSKTREYHDVLRRGRGHEGLFE